MCNLIGQYRSRGNARLLGHQFCLSQQKYLLLQQHQSHSHYIPKLINNWAVISPYSFGTGEVFFIKQISKQPFADVLQNRLLGNQICLSKHKYLLVQQHQSWQIDFFPYPFGVGGLFSKNRIVSIHSQNFLKTGVLKSSEENTCVRVSF